MTRKTVSMSSEAAERLESHRNESESFSEFAIRIAAILDEIDDGTAVNVTEPLRADEDDESDTDIAPTPPDDVLTESHLDDIVSRCARRTADELETRLR